MEVGEINGRIHQLREQNQREHGGEMVGGKLRTAGHRCEPVIVEEVDVSPTNHPEYDFEQLRANRAAPNPPWGFSVVDFAALEKSAQSIQEATDDWVAAEEKVPARVWETDPLTTR